MADDFDNPDLSPEEATDQIREAFEDPEELNEEFTNLDLEEPDSSTEVDEEEVEESTPERAYGEADPSEIEEAEDLDLNRFRGTGPSFEKDAFEAWVQIKEDHPVLDTQETDLLVDMLTAEEQTAAEFASQKLVEANLLEPARQALQGEGDQQEQARQKLDENYMSLCLDMLQHQDTSAVEYAKDRLVRHNILWIITCLRRYAGSKIMDRPSDMRDDMLSLGRMAFLEGLGKYDIEKAVEKGSSGHKKTILKYCEFWIRKRVGETLKRERYGLNEDAALDRNRVMKARKKLKKELDRQPSPEEIAEYLERQAEKKLEEQGVEATSKRLRRKGALSEERIRQLLRHRTNKTSFDAPAIPGESDGPTLKEYIEAGDASPDEVLALEERRNRLEEVLSSTPSRKNDLLARWAHGLRSKDGRGRHTMLNPEEQGMVLGRTRDTANSYVNDFTHRFQGEQVVEARRLRSRHFPYSLEDLEAQLTERDELSEEVRDAIRRETSLKQEFRADGISVTGRGGMEVITCPFEDCGGRAEVDEESFECGGCDRNLDLVDWLQEFRGLKLREAVMRAGIKALGLPPSVETPDDEVTVIEDPERRAALRTVR